MQIDNSFSVPLPIDQAWAVLLDVPRIAPCLPGARLEEVTGEHSYKGEVAVRLGPVLLAMKGRAEITGIDAAAHAATVKAEARDTKGRGGSSAQVQFRLTATAPAETRVDIATTLTLSGAIAQYGRGAGMIGELADHLIGEFSRNLQAEIERSRPAAAAPAAAVPQAGAADEAPPVPPPVAAAPAPAARPISGLRLAWLLLRGAVRRLLGRHGRGAG